MDRQFLGYLEHHDPLFPFLVQEIYPQLGLRLERPCFKIERLSGSHPVYQYHEESSRVGVVSKFFSPDQFERKDRGLRLLREYENLRLLRRLGFDRPPHRVARPLGKKEGIGVGLVSEGERGRNLVHFFKEAIFKGARGELFFRLEQLASFLADLHQKTRTILPVAFEEAEAYFFKVLERLFHKGLLRLNEVVALADLKNRWKDFLDAHPDLQVIVHGDATPTNFLFISDRDLVAIDLERTRTASRMWDIGLICAEIKHAFLWRTRDPLGPEPFLHHFLKSYAARFPDPESIFNLICRTNPFYMALTELRIARNDYLDRPYCKRLIWEARKCLIWGLRLFQV